MEVMGETLSFENARFSGELLGAGESVSVKGTVRADVIAHCARCLAPVRHAVETAVDETFVRAENASADSDAYPIAGTEIELMDLVKDAVVLDLPCVSFARRIARAVPQMRRKPQRASRANCLEGDDDNPFAALRDLF